MWAAIAKKNTGASAPGGSDAPTPTRTTTPGGVGTSTPTRDGSVMTYGGVTRVMGAHGALVNDRASKSSANAAVKGVRRAETSDGRHHYRHHQQQQQRRQQRQQQQQIGRAHV